MRYASVDGPFNVSIREAPAPNPELGDVLVRSLLSGISLGTELAVFRGTLSNLHSRRWGYWTEYPIRPGYQLVGVVERCGAGVSDLSPGDRVVCHAPHGTLAAVSRQECVRIPQGVSDEDATFAMLGATTAHGVRRAGIRYGDVVLVLGLGVVGFLSADHALRSGAAEVLVADPLLWKRKLAETRGFATPLDPGNAAFEREVLERTGDRGADVVIEASGQAAAIQSALLAVARGGRILLQGTQTTPVQIDFGDYPMHKEVSLICSWGKGPARPEPAVRGEDPGLRTWSRRANQEYAMALIAQQHLRLKGLVTHRFRFEEVANVYSTLDRRATDCLQVILSY